MQDTSYLLEGGAGEVAGSKPSRYWLNLAQLLTLAKRRWTEILRSTWFVPVRFRHLRKSLLLLKRLDNGNVTYYTRTGPINTHHRNLSVIFMQPRRTMPRKFSA
jgi:hypothetical protein